MLLEILLGCRHKRYTFPITARGTAKRPLPAAELTGTYVVCLDCGAEMPYDWTRMKVITDPEGWKKKHRQGSKSKEAVA